MASFDFTRGKQASDKQSFTEMVVLRGIDRTNLVRNKNTPGVVYVRIPFVDSATGLGVLTIKDKYVSQSSSDENTYDISLGPADMVHVVKVSRNKNSRSLAPVSRTAKDIGDIVASLSNSREVDSQERKLDIEIPDGLKRTGYGYAPKGSVEKMKRGILNKIPADDVYPGRTQNELIVAFPWSDSDTGKAYVAVPNVNVFSQSSDSQNDRFKSVNLGLSTDKISFLVVENGESVVKTMDAGLVGYMSYMASKSKVKNSVEKDTLVKSSDSVEETKDVKHDEPSVVDENVVKQKIESEKNAVAVDTSGSIVLRNIPMSSIEVDQSTGKLRINVGNKKQMIVSRETVEQEDENHATLTFTSENESVPIYFKDGDKISLYTARVVKKAWDALVGKYEAVKSDPSAVQSVVSDEAVASADEKSADINVLPDTGLENVTQNQSVANVPSDNVHSVAEDNAGCFVSVEDASVEDASVEEENDDGKFVIGMLRSDQVLASGKGRYKVVLPSPQMDDGHVFFDLNANAVRLSVDRSGSVIPDRYDLVFDGPDTNIRMIGKRNGKSTAYNVEARMLGKHVDSLHHSDRGSVDDVVVTKSVEDTVSNEFIESVLS